MDADWSQLPGLGRLIAVSKQYGVGVDIEPPSRRPPRGGDLIAGGPFDPVLAAVYERIGGGRFGDQLLLQIGEAGSDLASFNEEMRRGWEKLEPRLLELFCYSKRCDFEYYLATVPSLARSSGVQPVLYLIDHDAKPILPIASSADRAFDLFARHLEIRMKIYGTLDAPVEAEHSFPWGFVKDVAQDRSLVVMLKEGCFERLTSPVPDARDWVEEVLASAT